MPIDNGTPIKFSEVREEGNKTSWVSPNYPTPGQSHNIRPQWSIDVDTNNMLGYDPSDGSFYVAQWQGWDTWKKPEIVGTDIMQFTREGGIRVLFEIDAGDALRSAYFVYVTTSEPSGFSNLGASELRAIVRFGPEWGGFSHTKTDLVNTVGIVLGKDSHGQLPSPISVHTAGI